MADTDNMGRTQVGEHPTQEGYTYWLDAKDQYVYTRRPDGSWGGYLCSSDVWGRTFKRTFGFRREGA